MLRKILLRQLGHQRRAAAAASAGAAGRDLASLSALRSRASPYLSTSAVSALSLPSAAPSSWRVYPKLHCRAFSTSRQARSVMPFKLHDIGEGITEVEVLKWDVVVGQEVQEFDVLCEVQSDKSTVELTAPATGKIKSLRVEVGQMVNVGQVLCEIQTGEDAPEAEPEPAPAAHQEEHTTTVADVSEVQADAARADSASAASPVADTERLAADIASSSPPPPPPSSPSSAPAAPARPRRRHPHDDSDDTQLTSARDSSMDLSGGGRFSGEASIIPSAPQASFPSSLDLASVPARESRIDTGPRTIVKASPAVRTLAARLGVPLESVRGTGEGGRVTRDDVQAKADGTVGMDMRFRGSLGIEDGAVPARQAAEAPQPSSAGLSNSPRDAVPKKTRVDFGRTRKVMWRAMGDMGSVPHFGYSHTLNLTPLLPYIRALTPPKGSTASQASYLASDIPAELARDPVAGEIATKQKTTLLSFLIKGLLLALEEHPIMRARVQEKDGQRWLEIGRDAILGVAVSGKFLSVRGADPELTSEDPKFGLLTPSLPPMPPTAPLGQITSALSTLRQTASKPSAPPVVTISSVGALGEARGAMPVLPPGGGVAICAVGRARWEVEWKVAGNKRAMDLTPQDVVAAGQEAVLRVPVGWSGDHRVLEGAELIAFTETWKKYIEEPWRWLKID